MKEKIKAFLGHPMLSNRYVLLGLWLLLALAGMLKYHRSDNNFLIFRGVFWHTVNGTSLYEAYPSEYWDVNHYGPVFSLVIAPFALLPEWAGMLLWLMGLTVWLYVAVYRSGLPRQRQVFIYWFCSMALLTALFMQQFNIAIAAIILSSFYLIEKEHDGWAAFFIVLGTFVKLYGIVGLAFFFFSKHKVRLIMWLAVWSVVLFCAPMDRLFDRKKHREYQFLCPKHLVAWACSAHNGLHDLLRPLAHRARNVAFCVALSAPFAV